MRYLKHNKILIVILVLFVVMFPMTISLPQQSRSENIVTAIGIDKSGEEYEISLQYLVPGSSDKALKCSSIKGKSVGEAIEKFNLDYGKVSGFAHCRVIVFNNEAGDGNLNEALDYIQRIKTNTNNIFIVSTEKSAKDLLSSVKDLNSEFYVILSRDSVTGQHNHYESLKSFGDYYNAMLGNVKCIAVNNINVEQDNSSGGGNNAQSEATNESSSQGSSSGGGQNSEHESKKIKNDGSLTIIKDNKRLLTLDSFASDCLNWFNSKIKDMTLKVSNYNDDIYQNCDITFDVYKRFTNVSTYFVNGKPFYKLSLVVDVTIIEAVKESLEIKEFIPANNLFSDKLKQAVVAEIKHKLTLAESNFKTNKYDVVNCYEHFNKFNNKQFKHYLQSLKDGEYFLEDITFVYDITVRQWD